MDNSRRSFLKKAALGTVAAVTIPEIVSASAPQKGLKRIKLLKDQTILFQGESIADAGRNKADTGYNNPGALGQVLVFKRNNSRNHVGHVGRRVNTVLNSCVLYCVALAVWMGLSVSTQAELSNPNTDWFSQAKYGVFVHFLPSGKAGLKQVEQLDVRALASQLEEMEAGYFVLTLGQNSGYFNSPNAAYEKRTGYVPGERCANRDLPADLYRALQPKGIRLMLYLPCQTPNEDARAQKAFGLPQGPKDQPIGLAFAEEWSEVIQEWADRYGEKVAGWWFDGGYEHVGFNDAIADRYAAAVKHGNPKAIVTFNPGVKVIRWTKAEDYTAGELGEPLQFIPTDRWLAGSQWHALTYLGDSWMRRNTRFTDEQWVEWARKVIAKQGVLTFDMGPNYDADKGPVGQLAEVQVKQVKAIGAALRHGQNSRLR